MSSVSCTCASGTIPRYGLGRFLDMGLVCWNISICSKVCCKLLHRSYGRFLCLYGLRSSHLIRFIFERSSVELPGSCNQGAYTRSLLARDIGWGKIWFWSPIVCELV
ncbi:hypothetical protein RHGRI_012196 [Rhododendron griersonianum]|uniref:Uncharacterized protein n=1 Tax=Rhododendron griersonianum TaxID=479676 RepID=A0AAV6KQ63_9ERIC|nr:hypothetical protein RHGRI_012196 [Rhododendron griersonianum]